MKPGGEGAPNTTAPHTGAKEKHMTVKTKDALEGFGLLLDIEGELISSLPVVSSKSRIGSFIEAKQKAEALIIERALWGKPAGKKLVKELIHLDSQVAQLNGKIEQERKIESALEMVRMLLAPMREENKKRNAEVPVYRVAPRAMLQSKDSDYW